MYIHLVEVISHDEIYHFHLQNFPNPELYFEIKLEHHHVENLAKIKQNKKTEREKKRKRINERSISK